MITLLKGLIGLAWLGAVAYGAYAFWSAWVTTSSFTEQGMEWQRTHNPEFIKADALQKLVRLKEMQEEANRREQSR
jgi:hypothetical protein